MLISPTSRHLFDRGSYSSILLHKINFSFEYVILISYQLLQNFEHINSPSDCIQFSIPSNKRMTISPIIHISDSENSTASWSWGVETQTGFQYIIITKYMIIIYYLSHNTTTFLLQLYKFFHLAMQHRNPFVVLESLQLQSISVHFQIIDISFYFHDHQ